MKLLKSGLWFALLLTLFLLSCGDSDQILHSLIDISGAPIPYDESNPDQVLPVASVCLECSRDKRENLIKIENMIFRIMEEAPQTRLIVFGETTLGYYYGLDDPESYQRSVGETIPGPATAQIGSLADSFDVFIVLGMSELSGDTLYNAQVLLNPEGQIVAVHRKSGFVSEDEEAGFTRGRHATVASIDGIRIGMIICADVTSYPLTEDLVAAEIQILIHSLASLAGEFRFDATARQFNSWVIFANRYGHEGDQYSPGTCHISDPAGNVVVGGEGQERYLTYTIGVSK